MLGLFTRCLSSQSINYPPYPLEDKGYFKTPPYFKLTGCSFFPSRFPFPIAGLNYTILHFLTTHSPAPCPQQALRFTALPQSLLWVCWGCPAQALCSTSQDVPSFTAQGHPPGPQLSGRAHNKDTPTNLKKKKKHFLQLSSSCIKKKKEK